jgi:V8-like Glu-specific endopeptidase
MTLIGNLGIRQAAWGLALAVFVLGGLWAQAAVAAGPATVSHTVAGSAAKAKQIRQFWTPHRMRQAEPMDVQVSQRQVSRAAATSAPTPRRGHPITIPPSLPKGSPAGTPNTKAQVVSDPTVYPYSTQGKLFFQWQGSEYVCSATVVNSLSKRVIFTAGHCEFDEGTWSRNVEFVPGYHNGDAPFGTFVASKLYSTPGWIQGGNPAFSWDMSAAVLRGTQPVANVVGSRGIKFNQVRQQSFVSFGYPAAFPFDGEKLWRCPSPYRGLDTFSDPPYTQWITCNMTGGSSGGGWIIQTAYLNSVNSYGYRDEPNRMYGPYFGPAAATLYNKVKNLQP